jgi:hypothetical protein
MTEYFCTGISLLTGYVTLEYLLPTYFVLEYLFTDWIFCTKIHPSLAAKLPSRDETVLILWGTLKRRGKRMGVLTWKSKFVRLHAGEISSHDNDHTKEVLEYSYQLNCLYWNISTDWMFSTGVFILTGVYVLEYFYRMNHLYWNVSKNGIFCTGIFPLNQCFIQEYLYELNIFALEYPTK